MSLLQAIFGARRATIELRRSPRQAVQFPAWADTGDGTLQDCNVLDVSDEGCRIAIANPAGLTEEFYLVMSRNGARRRCRLAWHSDDEAGLQYLSALERPPNGSGA